MSAEVLEKLHGLPGVVLCQPSMDVKQLHGESANSIRLPQAHWSLLKLANGIMVYGGYYRIFGLDCISCIDMNEWNFHETWKFAWPRHLDDYLCFGENAFGAQYAYRMSEMTDGRDPQIYFLEHMTMTPEPLANSFEAFLESEFLRCAHDPYYEFHKLTRARIGDLSWKEHVVHAPSMLISGVETIENVMRMPSVSSMVTNGDLAIQVSDEPLDRPINELQVYQDSQGRSRVRVVWADETQREP